MEQLSHHIAAVVEQLLEGGFEFPIHLVAVAVNGSIIAGSFAGPGKGFETSAHQTIGEGFTLPINLMFVNSKTGEAARILINGPDQTEYTIN